MLDDFAKSIMKTLIDEMEAVDRDGHIDHKTRLVALREARTFIKDILPRLSKEDRETFSHSIAKEMEQKLEKAIDQEKKMEEYFTDGIL